MAGTLNRRQFLRAAFAAAIAARLPMRHQARLFVVGTAPEPVAWSRDEYPGAYVFSMDYYSSIVYVRRPKPALGPHRNFRLWSSRWP